MNLCIGSFPYSPGYNPYQRLFTESLEYVGLQVLRIPPQKWFPLSHACKQPVDLLHLDWHHDWYDGRSRGTRLLKQMMYKIGLYQCQKLPVVWTAHNLVAHDAANPDYDRQMTQQLINCCSGVMVMSQTAGKQLAEYYDVPERTRVIEIPHGHYIDCYPNSVSRLESRKQLKINEDEFVFICLGGLRRYKGHLDLISAFAKTSSPGERLLIAGGTTDVNYRNEIVQRYQAVRRSCCGKIDLRLQNVADDDMQIFFNASDVSVLPFRRILNSGSMLLSMSFGKPVVAPSLGSIAEVADKEFFFGYDGTERGLCQAMETATAKLQPYHEGRESEVLERTRTRFDWNRNAEELKAFYLDLVNYKRPVSETHLPSRTV